MRGVTLIETMMVVVITAILAALATPSFLESFRRYRVDSAREDMQASITLARIEAIRNSNSVVIGKTLPCGTAPANEWNCGWQVFIDANNDNVFNGTDRQIFQVDGLTDTVVRKANVVSPAFISFDRLGNVNQLGQRFEFHPSGLAALQGQLICFTTGNRVRSFKNLAACP
jgi:type IV fimbrial biogenesis protein FimT